MEIEHNFALPMIKSYIFKLIIFILVFIGFIQISIYFTLMFNLLTSFILIKQNKKENENEVYFCETTPTDKDKNIDDDYGVEELAVAAVSIATNTSIQEFCITSSDNNKIRKRKRKKCCGQCCAYLV